MTAGHEDVPFSDDVRERKPSTGQPPTARPLRRFRTGNLTRCFGSPGHAQYAIVVPVDTTDAGSLLREARTAAGLSQAELASRAGVTQSVISVYEAGRRQPSLPTLAALIAATGHELEVTFRSPQQGLRRLTGPIGRRLRRRRTELMRIAAEHGVRVLGVFGSVARGEDRLHSDIDLLVEFPVDMGMLGLGRVRGELEDLLGCSVDLIPEADLKPGVRSSVEADLVRL